MIKNAVEQSVKKFTHDDGGMNASAKLNTFSSHNSTFLGLFRELRNVNSIMLLQTNTSDRSVFVQTSTTCCRVAYMYGLIFISLNFSEYL